MKRPESHEIDEKAKNFFVSALPASWVKRPEQPDYGIDYTVEVFDRLEATGIRFAVQLKGTCSPSIGKQTLNFQLATNHLKYYVDKMRLPVFLVVVDVGSSKGYWVFLQEYARRDLKSTHWRKQKTVTIRLPLSNSLQDHDLLRRRVEQADRLMAELRPAAIPGAIAAEQERLQGLDARFYVETVASVASVRHTIRAKERVPLKLVLKGPRDLLFQKADDLIGRGRRVKIGVGELDVIGSPLLKEILSNVRSLRVASQREASIRLVARDKAGSELASTDPIPCHVISGTREWRAEGHLPDSPLSVDLVGGVNQTGTVVRVVVNCQLTLGAWAGQKLGTLAYFEQITSVFGAIARGAFLRVKWFEKGNHLGTVDTDVPGPGNLKDFIPTLSALEEARAIASRFRLDPVFPSHFGENEAQEIHIIHSLLHNNEYRYEGRDVTVRATVSREWVERLCREDNKEHSGNSLTLDYGGDPLPFLGEEVNVGRVAFTLTEPILVEGRDHLRKLLQENKDEFLELKWVAGPKSEFVARKEPPSLTVGGDSKCPL